MGGEYDVAVVGGGPVGAALALELHASGLRVTLLEARAAAATTHDARPIALSHGSRLIFERLQLWDAIEPATPIRTIHVSHRGRFGRAALTAAEADLPALGYVIDYSTLVAACDAALQRAALDVRRGAQVTTIAHGPASARVEFATAAGMRECIATLVAIADGGALAADVEVRTVDYGQSAVTACIETEVAHGQIAYERFTPTGPIALLPFGARYALVWTMPRADADALIADSAERFSARLHERFGDRVGRMTLAGPRTAHQLVLRTAHDITWGRAVLIGNAAQSLHPVAGQGFNVGLRDAWELTTEIRRAGVAASDLFARYRTRRRIDRAGAIAFTDGLVRLFSNDLFPLAVARGVGLTLLDCLPPVKSFVVRRMIFGARG